MTVIEAAVEVLKNSKSALSAKEIFAEIERRHLYAFKAKDPVNVLRAQLRRHSEGYLKPGASYARRVRVIGKDRYEAI